MDEAAGYRMLRQLARGSRAELWLGFDPGQVPEEGATETSGEPVVLKLLAADADPTSLAREVAALQRAAGEHVVTLLDVDTVGERPALVFERLTRGDLAELLGIRDALDAGEAVTILAPLATTLRRLHAAGVALGGLVTAQVMFRADGAPTLTGFGGAVLFEPGAPEIVLERVDAVAADRRGLATIAATVLTRVTGSRARVARQLLAGVEGCAPVHLAELLGAEVFELAAAVPVRFAADPGESPGAPESPRGRLVPIGAPVTAEPAEQEHRFAGSALLASVLERGPGAVARAEAVARWRGMTPPRRRLLVGVGAAVVAVAIAVAVVPGSGSDSRSGDSAGAAGAPTPTQTEVAWGDHDVGALSGDDPIVATTALLDRRATCYQELSIECLGGVTQSGSAAFEVDRAAIRAVLDGGELPPKLDPTTVTPTVAQRLGDTVLIALGPDAEPASILLMKGEAGWRIRDYVTPATEPEG